ncbi:MAG: hypothetical protein DRP64_04015 [Verrucomicrobia bacterium]|nr:MAG: hypothetical protein DRP64_04015 [Verrucomicrobiota bacterium]
MELFTKQKLSMMVPMRDGIRLSCDIRFPDGDGPFPVVLERTPYNKALDLLSEEVGRWTSQGYAFVCQDCRGRHESEGVMEPMSQEILDGVDTVDWIARQDFCNGQVVMTGESYCGWTQLAAASTSPSALKAITPCVMNSEAMDSSFTTGGIIDTTPVWWLLLNTNRGQMADPVGDWDSFYKNLPINRLDETLGFEPMPAFREALDPATAVGYRKKREIFQGLETCDVPILLCVGWYDVFASGSMKDAAHLIQQKADCRVIAGPWGHSLATGTTCGDLDFGQGSMLDMKKLRNEFIAHHLKGTPLPTELGKPIHYFLMGSNVWKGADCWPPAESEEQSFFIDSVRSANSLFGDGMLSKKPPSGRASDEYQYDPLNPVPAIGGAWLSLHAPAGPMDQRPAERRDDVLCYTSDELLEPLDLAGIPRAELFVESSAVDTDFFVRLCEVYPDGRSMLVCDGGMSLRCRNGADRNEPNKPGECHLLRIELASTAIRIMPGHQLRVEITSSCFPRYVRNLNSATHPLEETESDAVIAEQTIHHSTGRPSKIILPVLNVP